jgi:hypothetical protein
LVAIWPRDDVIVDVSQVRGPLNGGTTDGLTEEPDVLGDTPPKQVRLLGDTRNEASPRLVVNLVDWDAVESIAARRRLTQA